MRCARSAANLGDEGTLLADACRMFLNLRNSVSSDDVAVVDEVEAIKVKFEDARRDGDESPAACSMIDGAYAIM